MNNLMTVLGYAITALMCVVFAIAVAGLVYTVAQGF